MKKETIKKLTPNRAVNIFFGDGNHEEKSRLFAEKHGGTPEEANYLRAIELLVETAKANA